jgi:hypothetical protein
MPVFWLGQLLHFFALQLNGSSQGIRCGRRVKVWGRVTDVLNHLVPAGRDLQHFNNLLSSG